MTKAKPRDRQQEERAEPSERRVQERLGEEMTPKGLPTSDRHEAETTAGRIAGKETPHHHH